MTTVGFIGSGSIGGTVARLAVAAGYDVVMSNSRGPETLKDLVDELGPQAKAATVAEAATADLIVVSVPLHAYQAVPPVAGKVVIDTNNYYPQRDGNIAALDDDSATSSELLQRHLPSSHVVKVFNNIYYKHLASLPRPAGATDRTALPLASDDADAKATVVAFLDAIGYDAVDAGTLADSRRFQPGSAAYGGQYGEFTDEKGTPADAAKVRAALGQ